MKSLMAASLISMDMMGKPMMYENISEPNPIPNRKTLKPSNCHTSYAQDKRNSKKIKNRKRSKR